MRKLISLGLCAALLVLVVGCGGKKSEDPLRSPGNVSTQFVPENSFAAIVVHPQRVLKSKTLSPIKLDFMMEEMKEEMGFDLRDVEQVVVIMTLGSRGEPEPNTVFRMKSTYDQNELRKLSSGRLNEEVKHNGKSYFTYDQTYELAKCIAYPDDRTILYGETQNGMKQMLGSTGSGQLAATLNAVDTDHDALAVVNLAPIRQTLVALAREESVTEGYADVPSQIESIVATADLDPTPRVDIVISAASEKDAESLKNTVAGLLVLGKGALGEVRREASREMGDEFAGKLVTALNELITNSSPQVDGSRLTISVQAPSNAHEFIDKMAELADEESRRQQAFKARREEDVRSFGKGDFKDGFKEDFKDK